jgi:regulator of cell morphogenesis and NO signaling
VLRAAGHVETTTASNYKQRYTVSNKRQTIDPEQTINEVVQKNPQTLRVLNGYGLDTCCGGPLSLTEAARRHGLDLRELLTALEGASQ